MKINILKIKSVASVLGISCMLIFFSGCSDLFDFDLPEENSQVDTELPTADFSFAQDPIDFKKFQFTNLSTESTMFAWTFGTGDTSSEESPAYTFDEGEGSYTVSLISSDANGKSASITKELVVIEPEEPDGIVPTIFEADFEDGSLDGGSGDGRDSWRNNSLGGVIQITSDPVFSGEQAAKFPSEGDRIAYQELEISPNTDYKFTFYYTMKTDSPGSITFDVLAGGGHTSVSGAEVLGSFTGTDQTSSSDYVEADLLFNTGANTTISIYIHNEGAESRMDLVTIKIQ